MALEKEIHENYHDKLENFKNSFKNMEKIETKLMDIKNELKNYKIEECRIKILKELITNKQSLEFLEEKEEVPEKIVLDALYKNLDICLKNRGKEIDKERIDEEKQKLRTIIEMVSNSINNEKDRDINKYLKEEEIDFIDKNKEIDNDNVVIKQTESKSINLVKEIDSIFNKIKLIKEKIIIINIMNNTENNKESAEKENKEINKIINNINYLILLTTDELNNARKNRKNNTKRNDNKIKIYQLMTVEAILNSL